MNIISGLRLIAQMKLNQWKSQNEIEEIQEQKLKDMFSYACSHVPYYRKSLKDIGFRGMDDLQNLPIMKKEDLRLNTGSLISDQYPKDSLKPAQTSGSSGTPLTVYHHPSESYHGPACEIHQFTEAGIGPFDTVAHIAYPRTNRHMIQKFGVYRRHFVPMKEGEKKNLEALAKLKPKALFCNPSYLVPLAYENLLSKDPIKIKTIFSYSEVLSKKARELLVRSFGSEVYDMYGVVETSWVAWQCEKGSMHLYSDSMVAEISDAKGNVVPKGKQGRVLLTTLWKRSMPLLRYQTTDRSAFGSKCRCGRGLHTLKPIEGRDDDFIVMPSGRATSAFILDICMQSLPGVRLFQVIQEEIGSLHIKIVPIGKPPSEKAQKELIKNVHGSFPEKFKVTLEVVDSLPRGRTGKLRSVTSKVGAGIDL